MSLPQTETKNKPDTIDPVPVENQSDYDAWRERVSYEFHRRELFEEAERWDYCNSSPRYTLPKTQEALPPDTKNVFVCSGNHAHDSVLFAFTCDNRVCPDCASRHSARLLRRYVEPIGQLARKHPELRLKTLVFTRSVEIGQTGFRKTAQEGFSLIQKAMRKVIGSDWNKNGAGMLANWEIGSNGLKLHYHVVYLGKWVDQRKLSKAWQELTGNDFVVWVRGVKQNDGDWQKSIIYTLKYATKFYSTDKATGKRKYLDPSLTVDLYEALKGTRRIRSYGSFFKLTEPEKPPFVCKDCNSPMVRIPVSHFLVWRNTGFDEFEWKDMLGDSLLNLNIANKSPPERDTMDKVKPGHTRMLPGFADIREVGMNHYDYEN